MSFKNFDILTRGAIAQNGKRVINLIEIFCLCFIIKPAHGLRRFTAFCEFLADLAACNDYRLLSSAQLQSDNDDTSLDLLQHLQAHAAELPLALVMTGRPALLERRPDWGTPETTVQLGSLAATESTTLAGALLQRIAGCGTGFYEQDFDHGGIRKCGVVRTPDRQQW